MVQLFTTSFRMVVCYRGTVPTNMSFDDGVHQIEVAALDNAIGRFFLGFFFFFGECGDYCTRRWKPWKPVSYGEVDLQLFATSFQPAIHLCLSPAYTMSFVSSRQPKFETLLCPNIQNS